MMSPTINASSLQTPDNPLFKLAQPRKTSDSSTASSDSLNASMSGDGGVTFAPVRKPTGLTSDLLSSMSAPHNNRRAGGSRTRDWFDVGRGDKEEEEEEERAVGVLGAARLVHLPNPISRDRRRTSGKDSSGVVDEAGGDVLLGLESPHSSDRPAFPASASVSLPTSTTALDYLLHQHNSGKASASKNDLNNFYSSNTSSTVSTGASSAESLQTATLTLSRASSSNDYLTKYHASLGLASRDNDASSAKSVSSNTMMTKTVSDKAYRSTGSNPQEAGDMTRKSSAAGRGKHTPKAISQQFFQVEPCLFTHRMFVRAAKIFEVLKSEDTDTLEAKASKRRTREPEEKQKIPDMDFRNAQEQIKTFELTFATLKCK
ncbi:hypothetical protein ElyMa_001926800 [Elysia marginata]|uniref:Uncharacterized protein n=1 Tax=Elysia marginata TaxID=1093978 RepID=A0AAV4EW84_9GAST|nr:hypothetical protein ElyMa_001926800 [Elysia marginata]